MGSLSRVAGSRRQKVGRLVSFFIWMTLFTDGSVAAGLKMPDVQRLQAADLTIWFDGITRDNLVLCLRLESSSINSFAYPIYELV
jgi:hypothetical protein